jgi:Ca-activated chloride channel family protein
VLLVLVAIGLFYYKRHAKEMSRLFQWNPVKEKDYGKVLNIKFIFLLSGIFLLIIALCNPQWGNRKEKMIRTSSDIFVALDISKSMMAEDVSPSRLDRAKKIGERLIQALRSERIGLILFAGEAYMQMPLTNDYLSAISFLRTASPNMAGTQGTAIAEAIMLAQQRFNEKDNANRLLIILSDGEDHEAMAMEAAQEAYENGTMIFTIGIGTEQGELIPVILQNRQDYVRNKQGEPVRSKMNPEALRDIAEAGGGSFFTQNVRSDMLDEIKEKVRKLEKKTYEERAFTAHESYFQWFLFPAILLIFLGFSNTANFVREKIKHEA